MDWILFLQIVILMVIVIVGITTIHGAAIDKRREDTIKRKEAGVWLEN